MGGQGRCWRQRAYPHLLERHAAVIGAQADAAGQGGQAAVPVINQLLSIYRDLDMLTLRLHVHGICLPRLQLIRHHLEVAAHAVPEDDFLIFGGELHAVAVLAVLIAEVERGIRAPVEFAGIVAKTVDAGMIAELRKPLAWQVAVVFTVKDGKIGFRRGLANSDLRRDAIVGPCRIASRHHRPGFGGARRRQHTVFRFPCRIGRDGTERVHRRLQPPDLLDIGNDEIVGKKAFLRRGGAERQSQHADEHPTMD
ncbi:MAG: hypothetical protein BWY76_02079 [bacterium ADurb.Bin429]|nr:MAG: hypothetical protein BWY76_02079 [bacterium ADurb.Bin429]